MTMTIEEHHNPNDIVISGISGVFPQSENIEEFKANLLAGVCMISQQDRWNSSTKVGLLKTIDRFDHSFFQITHSQAVTMPISSRLLLEKTFEAILDAGYNPSQLKGKNIAVVCGLWDCCDEGDPAWDAEIETGGLILGGTHAVKANRISYWLDIHGPSFAVHSACSASLYAMDLACKLMRSGECEAAIVCSSNLCFSNDKFLNNSPLLSQSGQTSAFSADENIDTLNPNSAFSSRGLETSSRLWFSPATSNHSKMSGNEIECPKFSSTSTENPTFPASGYIRAEAVVVNFLQKRQHARRIYAKIVHTKTNCDGFKPEGSTFPSLKQQKQLFKQFYEEIGLDPSSVSYVETHGTATQAGDFVEGTSLEEIFCPNRKTPLRIGSVKSNMGHAEASSGLCSLAKMIISFESGTIPPHIGYENPNPKIKGLHNGNLQVVTKPTPLNGKYFAVNNFGVGGANGHMLLTPHDKDKKSNTFANYGIPLLVTVSGRTEEAVYHFLDDVKKNSADPEYVRLIHEIFSEEISGNSKRGYIILDAGNELRRSQKLFTGEQRPIWFVFAGMGSQWHTMGVSLMTIPIFAESIRKSHQILQSKEVDLIKIITKNDPLMFKNILNSFVGIAAIQIALVDVLTALEIEPDGIIGHSVGELGCAYADGCLTAEQTILAAYYRGLVSLETNDIVGKMASIGASYMVMKDHIPPEIDIACHNGPTNCTISGPTRAVEDLIVELQQKNIFVREVDTSNIAYHSRYIAPAAPKFNWYLKKIIPKPKLRSKKWICSSALAKDWHTDRVKYSSSEYHTNNLLNPVYFEESCKYIPDNAVLVEIAPHGLLNAILKRSMPQSVINIPLTLRNHQNQVEYFLDALGQMYEAGCVPKLSNLYPKIEFPVSKSTPAISHLIKWQHDEQWPIGNLDNGAVKSSSRNVLINPQTEAYKFLHDHNINRISVYPGFGYLVMVWETLANIYKQKMAKMPVVFENVSFERITRVPETGTIKFHIAIHVITNHFEVTESGVVVTKGIIRFAENINNEVIGPIVIKNDTSDRYISMLNSEDFYKEMRLRRYCYKNTFKRVVCANSNGTYGKVSWNDNFITFMDAMLQISLLNVDTRGLLVPTFIRKIVINVEKHFEMLKKLNPMKTEFVVNFHPDVKLLTSGGIQMTGWKTREIIRRQHHQAKPVVETYQFVPYVNNEKMDFNLAIRTCIHIASENIATIKIKTIELLDSKSGNAISGIMSQITIDTMKDIPCIQASVNVLIDSEQSAQELESLREMGLEFIKNLPEDKNYSIIFTSNIRSRIKILSKILDTIRDDGCVITKESIFENGSLESLGFVICFSRIINSNEKILLLRKVPQNRKIIKLIEIKNDTFLWISELQNTLKKLTPENNELLILYSEKNPMSGILGLFNCVKAEKNGSYMRCFFLMDEKAEKFSLQNSFYKTQYDKNLTHNVCKGGQWGSYRHLPMESPKRIKTIDAVCQLMVPGDFSSCSWIESSLITNIKSEGGSLARVHYSGLNFKDIMLGSRKLSNLDSFYYSRLAQNRPGFEFSGQDENGNRVMGIVHHGGIATFVKTIPHFTWKVPHNITLEEAASIPVAYVTVIYAFFSKMSLKRGSSVLIHAGTGGVGQAAINICLHYNCNIFTTVGSPDKVKFIRNTYPQIPETHICNSRDTSFETVVMQETNGKGVDVVLNCLSADKMQASVRCVARCGHFLEIGKSNTELGCFLDEITLHSVQLDYVIRTQGETSADLSEKFQEMLDQGIIKPIPRVVFQVDQVETAFKYMASAKHIGKVVLKIQDEENACEVKPNMWQVNARPFVNCCKNKSYLIVGGLGGFGLELADWLIIKGARNIVLSSRSGIKNGYQTYRINLWRSYGVNVVISTEDVTEEAGVRTILQQATALGPVAGIFNLAVILNDKLFPQQTEDSFRMSVAPKAMATAHLDKLSRNMCTELEYFVVFSSLSVRGQPELSNYAFANSIMERICEKRKSDKLPALAIQWGAIGEVGVVAEITGHNESTVIAGSSQQSVESCLTMLDIFMKQQIPNVSSMIVASKHHAETDVIDVVANTLGINNISNVSQTWTLPELGMDSILAMELGQILESEFNIFFTPEELRKLTFVKLYQLKDQMKLLKSEKRLKTTNERILPTRFSNAKTGKHHSAEGNPSLFIIPGLEGTTKIMEPLTKNLPVPVLCFQYDDIESALNFFTKLRDNFVEVILENLKPNQEFCIIGYSLGGLLAIEVVSALEELGRKGCLWLIDTSPAYLDMKATAFIKKQSSWENENSKNDIQNGENSTPNVAIERTFILAQEILNYNFAHAPLISSCILIKSAEYHFGLDYSWNLNEYFKNPVEVYQIDDSNHNTVLSDPRTARLIMESSILKPKITNNEFKPIQPKQ